MFISNWLILGNGSYLLFFTTFIWLKHFWAHALVARQETLCFTGFDLNWIICSGFVLVAPVTQLVYFASFFFFIVFLTFYFAYILIDLLLWGVWWNL